MAKYEVNGIRYEFPDEMSQDDAWSAITEHQGLDENGNKLRTKPSPVNTLINPEDLANDPDYLHAANVVWRHKNGKDFDGKPEDLAAYGLSTIRWINSNSVNAAVTAAMTVMEDDEYKQSLKHLFEKHDTIKYSLSGFMENAAAQFADPLNYFAAASFGLSAVGGQATKMLSKEALVQALKLGYREALVQAPIAAAQNVATQATKVAVEYQDEIDKTEVALSGVLGGVAAGALSAVGDLAVTGVKQARGKGGAKAVPGGTPNATPGSPEQALEAVPVGAEPRLGSPGSPGAEIMDAGAGLVKINPKPLPGEPDAASAAEILPPWKTNPIIDAVNDNAADTGMRVQPVGREALSNAGKPVVDEILALDEFSLKTLLEEARKEGFRGESNQVFKASLAEATQKLLTDLTEADDLGQMYHAYKRLELIRGADLDFSSASGRDLGFRVGMINTGEFRDVTPESILRDWNIDPFHATPEQKDRAMQAFQQKIVDKLEEVKINREYQRMTDEIDELGKQGKYAEAAKLHAEREALAEALINDADTLKRNTINTVIKGVVETVVSNVMSTTTVAFNSFPQFLKSSIGPAGYALVKGPTAKPRVEAASAYAAIGSSQKAALRAAMAAFQYESNLLGKNLDSSYSKMLEHAPVIPRKNFGGVVRFFPRVLLATDEYFSQLNYRAFVAGRVAGQAWDEAVAKGLSGKEFDSYIKTAVKEYEKYAFQPRSTSSVINFLRVQGVSNGLKGKELDAWIARQLNKNKDLFNEAVSQWGRDYADDIAFRKEFSETNALSRLAKFYEEWLNTFPAMRIIQPFFRTPIRVVQNGIEMTPGAQLLSPAFKRDLMGRGPGGQEGPAQMRAWGVAMMGSVLASAAVMMYAKGSITGAGMSLDWKQRRSANNPDWQPYTIDFGDGTKFNYRNFDPISFPFRVITNSLEQLHMLQYRRAQGENVDSEITKVLDTIWAVSTGVMYAIKDANLLEGVDQLAELFAVVDSENVEDMSENLVRFVGKKAQMLIPSTIGKTVTAFSENPTMSDPRTLEQFLRVKINPEDPLVPRLYDPTGNPISAHGSIPGLFGIQVSTPDSRATGNPVLDDVRRELASLTIQADRAFIAPYDGAKFAPGPMSAAYKGVDLRTKYTQDMEETWYDRLQRYTAESGVVEALHAALVGTDIPVGTAEDRGAKVEIASKILTTHRRMAWIRLMQEEGEIMDKNIETLIKRGENKAGFRDNPNIPFGNK